MNLSPFIFLCTLAFGVPTRLKFQIWNWNVIRTSIAIQPSLYVSRNTTQCKEELLLVVLRLHRVVCPSWATVSLALCVAALLYYYYSAGVNKFGGWKVPWALSCSPYSTHYFYLKLSFVWVKSNSLATNSWLQSTVYARLTSNNSGFIICIWEDGQASKIS